MSKQGSGKLIHPAFVDLWLCRPDEISREPQCREMMESLLDEDELKRMHRFKYERHATQFCISHAFTRRVLSGYCGLSASAIRFQKNRHGKPFIANPGATDVQFSLSHTNDLQVLAVGRSAPLGCDVEWRSQKVRGPEIADRFFSDEEVERLLAQPKTVQESQFFDYWSLKESFIKAKGMGLALPLGDFSFLLTDRAEAGASECANTVLFEDGRAVTVEAASISIKPHLLESNDRWQFLSLAVSDEHAVALATYGVATSRIKIYDANQLGSTS